MHGPHVGAIEPATVPFAVIPTSAPPAFATSRRRSGARRTVDAVASAGRFVTLVALLVLGVALGGLAGGASAGDAPTVVATIGK